MSEEQKQQVISNKLGTGREMYYPARPGKLNHYQVKEAAHEHRFWPIHLVLRAPKILREQNLYRGPDWNKEEMNSGEIQIEPGRPSNLQGPLFPWPEDSYSRYKENYAGDGLLFEMEGPDLYPPRGEHNPIAYWCVDEDPAHQPQSGVGFTFKANKNAHIFWEHFWLAENVALRLINTMKVYADKRRQEESA